MLSARLIFHNVSSPENATPTLDQSHESKSGLTPMSEERFAQIATKSRTMADALAKLEAADRAEVNVQCCRIEQAFAPGMVDEMRAYTVPPPTPAEKRMAEVEKMIASQPKIEFMPAPLGMAGVTRAVVSGSFASHLISRLPNWVKFWKAAPESVMTTTEATSIKGFTAMSGKPIEQSFRPAIDELTRMQTHGAELLTGNAEKVAYELTAARAIIANVNSFVREVIRNPTDPRWSMDVEQVYAHANKLREEGMKGGLAMLRASEGRPLSTVSRSETAAIQELIFQLKTLKLPNHP